ncbi:hypothetical protein BK816_04955 [Boudabousia tangfeifanii]|uniref:ABC transporter domain-containing protein n=1 Tax=Boudabousia tangfeifanii TaxID=1912795 RepID=A0A1D9MKB5_9ACTO|nr:ATP-binding cassette domain-containing protein [Boudabousia tangfeifanii]AOZ72722.1 hypothetical protein BK816_04955 [Boudabousia tangfeifanii]
MELRIDNLGIKVGNRQLLSGINFLAASGDLVGIIGPSGCGKTTLLNTLGLLLPICQGKVFYNRADITQWSQRKISLFWRNHAAFVIQDAGIDEDENLAYNVSLKNGLRRNRADAPLCSALEVVGLGGRADESARILSGGEHRRLAIARAIYRKSDVIFADEPTASLDGENRLHIQNLLAAEAERGALVLISTHDQELAKACTKILDLSQHVSH